MTDLITRLESARCGSRELSDEVLVALGWTREWEERLFWHRPDGTCHGLIESADPSRSVDDALALVEEIGCNLGNLWCAAKEKDRPWFGAQVRRDAPYRITSALGAQTLALALCAALIRMKENEDG